MVADADLNGDGKLDLDEFRKLARQLNTFQF
jgi:hypothetical protein